MGSSCASSERLHLLHAPAHGDVEVLLGNGSGGLGGVVHLLLEVLAGLGLLEGEALDLVGGLLLEALDLLSETLVGQPLGVLVHLLAALLNELGALLASLDGLLDGELELFLVAVLDDVELPAASSGLLGVLLDNAS